MSLHKVYGGENSLYDCYNSHKPKKMSHHSHLAPKTPFLKTKNSAVSQSKECQGIPTGTKRLQGGEALPRHKEIASERKRKKKSAQQPANKKCWNLRGKAEASTQILFCRGIFQQQQTTLMRRTILRPSAVHRRQAEMTTHSESSSVSTRRVYVVNHTAFFETTSFYEHTQSSSLPMQMSAQIFKTPNKVSKMIIMSNKACEKKNIFLANIELRQCLIQRVQG